MPEIADLSHDQWTWWADCRCGARMRLRVFLTDPDGSRHSRVVAAEDGSPISAHLGIGHMEYSITEG